MLFFVTAVCFADRATMSIAGSAIAKDLHMGPVALGYIFSAFGWAYAIGQVPGGRVLDRFGSNRVYGLSLLLWSLFTLAQGFVGYFVATSAVTLLFVLRFLMGLAESPCQPGNSRIVAAWFPASERGTASAIFNSAQYLAAGVFTPIMGWLTQTFGWKSPFFFMGVVGILTTFVWLKTAYNPTEHPRINPAELEYIEQGGAVVHMDQRTKSAKGADSFQWSHLAQLLKHRTLLGMYIGTYCIGNLTYFFLTWFPVYLVKARGMSIVKAGLAAAVPAICGFAGGFLGGMFSDYLIKRGHSLTFARKTPTVIGMLLAVVIIGCNYVNTQLAVVVIMGLSFFGKGFGSMGWPMVADTAPKEIAGLAAGVFNTFGVIPAFVTPIVIGYLVKNTGSFNSALVFVGANALLTIFAYLVIAGEVKRIELRKS
jgi:ACS family glucarate transporter-like MFS transporter